MIPPPKDRIHLPELPPGVTEISVYRQRRTIVLHTLKDWREVVDYCLQWKPDAARP